MNGTMLGVGNGYAGMNMTIPELVEWLKTRDHQVTVCFRVETQGLYIKMIDMKTGQIHMGLLGFELLEKSYSDEVKLMLDDMYKRLMEGLGREERDDTEI